MINAVTIGGNIRCWWVKNGKDLERQQGDENQHASEPSVEGPWHKVGNLWPHERHDQFRHSEAAYDQE